LVLIERNFFNRYPTINYMICSNCNCTPDECQSSISPNNCPKCKQSECCCWSYL